jgi:hypothetical protein
VGPRSVVLAAHVVLFACCVAEGCKTSEEKINELAEHIGYIGKIIHDHGKNCKGLDLEKKLIEFDKANSIKLFRLRESLNENSYWIRYRRMRAHRQGGSDTSI